MTTRSVFVVTAKSESGDYYGPYVFEEDPTSKLYDFMFSQAPAEFDNVPNEAGTWGSYLYVKTNKVEVLP